MRKLRFTYEMSLIFDEEISNHYFALRCRPQNGATQTIYGYEFSLRGGVDECGLTEDCFGNYCYIGRRVTPHREFSFTAGGYAWSTELAEPAVLQPIYKYQSAYTSCGPALRRFGRDIASPPVNALETARHLMRELFETFQYVPGATTVDTKAEEAFVGGQGVCQDYAHIFIALCRQSGLAARYVAGLMIGEGASHAWAEVYHQGGWIGLDPTHDQLADDTYIKFSVGRDYHDCLLNRGLFRGSGRQTQKIYASVEDVT